MSDTTIPEDFDEDSIIAAEPMERAGRGSNARIRSPQRAAPAPTRDDARTSDTKLVRNRKRTEDKFFVDPRVVPQGQSYEWKRESCYGQGDPDHLANLSDNHWNPVPAERHPGLVVKKDGMVLMQRPAYLTDEAKREDYELAIGQVNSAAKSLTEAPQGQFDRNHPSAMKVNRLNTSHSTFIPEE